MKIQWAAVLMTMLLFAVATAAAAEGEDLTLSRFSACAEVRIAEIEVYVTDRQGNPVSGLTAENFKLYRDGRQVELTNFHEVTGQPASQEIAAEMMPQEPLLLVIYVDNVNIHPLNRSRFYKDLKEFLYTGLGRNPVRIMLVTNDRFNRARLSWGGGRHPAGPAGLHR